MSVYTYEMDILVDLSYRIIYEVIILSESNKTHLTLSLYPKISDVIEMVGVPGRGHAPDKFWLDIIHPSIYCDNHDTH